MRPASLPAPPALKSLMQSLAVLDAIMSPEWEYRYYSFDSAWDSNSQMGSMRNGSGDELFVFFNKAGCFIKGFAHEYWQDEISAEDFYQNVPAAFAQAVNEPAFTPSDVSFCAWYENNVGAWKQAIDDSRLDPEVFFLIQNLDGTPETYVEFAESYYEIKLGVEPVKKILDHKPISRDLAMSLNSEVDFSELVSELRAIEYQS